MLIKTINNEEELNTYVTNQEKTTLVYFSNPQMGPCKVMKPVLEFFAGQYSDQVSVVEVNIECDNLHQKYNIKAMPTMVIYNQGKETDRILGTVPVSTLVNTSIR